jgi:hypothetical protein
MNLRPIVAAAPEVALRGTVLRLVQQQGINSLEPLVDNLEQLARLEAMVTTSKPPLQAAGPDTPSHPLLTTPFRYPPLRHGSRFGSRQYRGMFYGSRSRSGCLVEGAYYSPTGPANSSAPGCVIVGRSHHFPLPRQRQAASFWARGVSDRWGISRSCPLSSRCSKGARLARHPLAFGRRAASTARTTPVIAHPLDLADNSCIRTWRWPPMAPSLAPLSQEPLTNTDAQLVAEACGRAIQVLGLSRDELSAVVGKHRTSIDRTGLDPKTKAGELALLLLRAYRSLHSLFGGDHALMRHWLEQPNHHLGEQPPRLLLFRIEGLNRVANYLDALRG